MIRRLKKWSWSDTFTVAATVLFIVAAASRNERYGWAGITLLLWSMVATLNERLALYGQRITRLETRLREKGMLDGRR